MLLLLLCFLFFLETSKGEYLKSRNLSTNTTSHDLLIVETDYWTATQIASLAIGITLYVAMFLISIGMGYACAKIYLSYKDEQDEKEEYKQVLQYDNNFAF